MLNLTLFEALFITHFVMDWLFQTKWEADNKSRKWLNLSVHCAIYTIGFIPALIIFKPSLLWLIFIFVTHFLLDRRNFEHWWLEKIKRQKLEEELNWNEKILLIGTDQTFHLVVLTAIVLLSQNL
jgi:hypothetical protein